jgi:hypothetical protein
MIEKMKTEDNIDNLGKQTPYTVPDNFFSDMEKNIMKRVAEEPKTATVMPLQPRRHNMRWLMAAAACAVVLIISGIMFFNHDEKTDMNDVEYAFGQLTEQDQAYVLALSQDDIFLDEQN